MQVERGKVYIFAGNGDLLVEEAPDPPKKTTITVRNHGGTIAWVGVEDVLREATPDDVRAWHRARLARGVECKNAECWCRPYLETS